MISGVFQTRSTLTDLDVLPRMYLFLQGGNIFSLNHLVTDPCNSFLFHTCSSCQMGLLEC